MTRPGVRATIERFLSPGLGCCYRCRRPWKVPATRQVGVRTWQQLRRLRWWGLIGVEEHSTPYDAGGACFPLCEGCWAVLTPQGRWPYYSRLIDRWEQDFYVEPSKIAAIHDAVMAGK